MEITDRFDDNTKISSYKDCPRKYFLRHVMNWRSEGTAVPLVFGLSWHEALSVIWTHAQQANKRDLREAAIGKFNEIWQGEGMSIDMNMEQLEALSPRTPNIAEEMLHNYIEDRWNVLSNARVVSDEQPFAVPIPNTERSWYVGRLDKVIEYNGQLLVIEHKTTSIYKKDGGFQSSYVEGWYSDSQVKGYQFGAGIYYPGLTQVWVDAALVHKTVHDKFRFIPVSHSFPLIKEWLDDTSEYIARIKTDEIKFHERGTLSGGTFPKNENSCFGKFGSCSFLDVCRTTADIPPDAAVPVGYMIERWSPFETLGLEKILNKE